MVVLSLLLLLLSGVDVDVGGAGGAWWSWLCRYSMRMLINDVAVVCCCWRYGSSHCTVVVKTFSFVDFMLFNTPESQNLNTRRVSHTHTSCFLPTLQRFEAARGFGQGGPKPDRREGSQVGVFSDGCAVGFPVTSVQCRCGLPCFGRGEEGRLCRER